MSHVSFSSTAMHFHDDGEGNKNKSTFSYLHMLTAWHCPHSPTACCCCSNQSISPACRAHSSKPASVDRRADRLKDTNHFTDPAQTSEHIQFYFLVLLFFLFFAVGSVLWRCWLGGRKGIRPVKNRVVGYWRGYLSGARCRLAYGPADTTATHCLLLQ